MACGVTEGVGVLRPLLSQSGPEDGTSFSFLPSGGRVHHKGVAGPHPSRGPGRVVLPHQLLGSAASLASLPVLRLLHARLRPCRGV